MYIYHALINTLSAHMIHINLNTIFYTHIQHSLIKTIYIRYYVETCVRVHTHTLTHTHTNTHTHTHTHTHSHTQTLTHTHSHTLSLFCPNTKRLKLVKVWFWVLTLILPSWLQPGWEAVTGGHCYRLVRTPHCLARHCPSNHTCRQRPLQ